MAFDPRIILGAGVGVQPIDTPLEIEAKRAALAQVRQKAQDEQQARQAQNDFSFDLQATGGDYDAAVRLGEQRGHNMLPIREQLQKHQNAIADGMKKQLDAEKLKSELLGRIIPNVKSQEDWSFWAPVAARIDPEFVQHVGPAFDQKRFESFATIGVDADKVFEAADEAHKAILKGDADGFIRNYIRSTRDQEDLDKLPEIAQGLHIPPALIQNYVKPGEQWTPDLVKRVEQLSITPEKQAELGDKAADNARQAAVNAETARHNRVEEGLGAGNLAIRRQEANKPASAKGEGGRGVTSGDAGKLADMDASVAQLRELKAQFGGNNPSGIMANVETYLPPGLGTAAKSKQAKIDIVRQLVGKGLEGGVLRKEDEVKYAKILPIVSDNDALAASKIDGAIAAIEQKKADHLDALQDAGYDTSRFRARQQAAPKSEDTKKKNPFR